MHAQYMPGSPQRGGRPEASRLNVPYHDVRDWEGFTGRPAARPQAPQPLPRPAPADPSVAVLARALSGGEAGLRNGRPLAEVPRNEQEQLAQHQQHLAWRRKEYARRLDAEARGEEYHSRPKPFSEGFERRLPGGAEDTKPGFDVDFEHRSRGLPGQVTGTREEIAWLQPPAVPTPVNWNGFWNLCPGHEQILQLMAVSGVTPQNSPSLVKHFMYPELLSCIQRLQHGTFLVHYRKGEPPHERYFYTKPLPLANRAQYCPFLCWAMSKTSQTAIDAVPLCNVMWVTPGTGTRGFRRYVLGDQYIEGPFVGKRRARCLSHGALCVWVYDGEMRCVEVLATDPLVFVLWMKLLEDVAQLNAALDTSGKVRALQRDIEDLRAADRLDELTTRPSRSEGLLSRIFRPANPPQNDGVNY